MKSVTLNIRISNSIKERLEDDAASNDMSLSDFIREIISDYYSEEINHDFNHLSINSFDFTFLVSWMYEKRDNNYDYNPRFTLIALKNIVFNVIKNDFIPENLKDEFEKVFADLLRYLAEYGTSGNCFKFSIPNLSGSFDYDMLYDFIHKNAMETKVEL